MNGRRFFPAPWGRACKLATAVATLVLVGAAVVAAWVPYVPSPVRLLLNLSALGITLGCALFMVRGYELAPGVLLVHRSIWTTRLSLAGLRAARVDPEATRRSLRICGNGGFFVFCGWFWNRRLGNYRLWATDLNRTVVLEFVGRTWVLSPDDPEGFVLAVKAQTGLE